MIPPEVLRNAKGLVILTVLKAGFLFSGRAGSGVIIARLPDGSWSPPTAVITGGAGVGGQIGAELTDFVFVLNSKAAVDSFSQFGSITLGGNVSLAAFTLGRNAEAAAAASMKSAAAVFAFSKTKGLFAGISLEGSAIIERREANRKFYGNNCKARNILAGRVEAPAGVEPLFRILDSRAFNNNIDTGYAYSDDEFYNDIPSEDTTSETESSRSRYRSTSSARRSPYRGRDSDNDSDDDFGNSGRRRATSKPKSSAWEDDLYDRYDKKPNSRIRRNTFDDSEDEVDDLNTRFRNQHFKSNYSDKPKVSRAEKPDFGRGSSSSTAKPSRAASSPNQAVALFSFEGEQQGDLPFKKGDVITIIRKSDSTDDWWEGRNNGVEGIFPANYVKMN